MGNKFCGPKSTVNCDYDNHEYSSAGGVSRRGSNKIIRQSKMNQRNIEGMKRQINDELNFSTQTGRQSSGASFSNRPSLPNDEMAFTMSFLKGAEKDESFSPNQIRMVADDTADEYTEEFMEWDKMTSTNEENFEISSEARDYNNQDLDDSKSEIQFDDGSDQDANKKDAFFDPFMKIDGGMADTQSFSLWKTLMSDFEEMTRLQYFKAEIKAGNKQYKDFYVFFKQ